MSLDKWLMLVGSLPQWLTVVAVFVGFYFAYHQLDLANQQLAHNRSVREFENLISISENKDAQNASIINEPAVLKAIQSLEGLQVPDSESDAKTYWAFRAVHLGHLNLICRVWELDGGPERGKAMSARFDGYERFAREIITKKLRASAQAVKDGGKTPADLAASDLWLGLQKYEDMPTKFVQWLDALDREGPN